MHGHNGLPGSLCITVHSRHELLQIDVYVTCVICYHSNNLSTSTITIGLPITYKEDKIVRYNSVKIIFVKFQQKLTFITRSTF